MFILSQAARDVKRFVWEDAPDEAAGRSSGIQKMNLSLPSNISKLRKEHSMTQEQLAEALGVTFAAVQNGNVEFPKAKGTTPQLMLTQLVHNIIRRTSI